MTKAPKPDMTSQGMFQTLSPDKKYLGDPANPLVPGTKKPQGLAVQRPSSISKEAIKLISKDKLQYKVPKQSEGFSFAVGKNLETLNATSPLKGQIQLNAKGTSSSGDKKT